MIARRHIAQPRKQGAAAMIARRHIAPPRIRDHEGRARKQGAAAMIARRHIAPLLAFETTKIKLASKVTP